MAGGGGTRFWPLSRNKRPKQLLNLTGKDVMINETLDRFSKSLAKENIFIITNADQAESMVTTTKDRIKAENIIVEPCGRNTTACIGYFAFKIVKRIRRRYYCCNSIWCFCKRWRKVFKGY